jgi:hypothetical protein
MERWVNELSVVSSDLNSTEQTVVAAIRNIESGVDLSAEDFGYRRAISVFLLQFRLQRADARSRSTRSTAREVLARAGRSAWNYGFKARELNVIRQLIVENEPAIIEAWHEHCGQSWPRCPLA